MAETDSSRPYRKESVDTMTRPLTSQILMEAEEAFVQFFYNFIHNLIINHRLPPCRPCGHVVYCPLFHLL